MAQTVNVPAAPPSINFQWDDPYNQVPNFDPNPIYTSHGVYDNTPITFTTPSLTAGQSYVITVTADQGNSFDAIVTVKDPNGNTIVNMQDTGTNETVNLVAPITGEYSIIVSNFGGTTGALTVNVHNALPNPQITTDFNLLAFDLEGNYMSSSSLTTNNYATKTPFEFGTTKPKAGETQVQYVIARSSVPTSDQPATHIRWIIRGNALSGIGPAEYFTVNAPNTKGHAMTNGSNGVAAYNDVSAVFSNQAPLPSLAGQFWTMTLSFANDTFTKGKTLRFTVGHGPQHNSSLTNGIGPDGGATSTTFTQADLFSVVNCFCLMASSCAAA